VKAAAVQLAATLDTVTNRATAAAAVRAAADRGARLVVLPEATMAGFGTVTTDLAALAEPLDGPFVVALHEVAAETGATVVAGTFEPAGGQRVFNTVVIVGPGGLLGSYRKVHLYDALGWCESDRVLAGETDAGNVPVVEVDGFSLGVLTCYDLRFPESARRPVDGGATVLAVPAAWVAGQYKEDHWGTLLGARAIENTSYVIAAAQPAPSYTGRSRIVDPFGVVVAELGPTEGAEAPAIVLGDLEADRVSEARAALPVLGHRRFDVAARPLSPTRPGA
jgi:predicted amidohydrolase